MNKYNPYNCTEKIVKDKDLEIEKLKSEIEFYKQGTIDFMRSIYEWNGILDTEQLHDRIISDVLMVGVVDTFYDKHYIPEDLYESICELFNEKK